MTRKVEGEKEAHPPVPPNCENVFEKLGDDWCFKIQHGSGWTPLHLLLREGTNSDRQLEIRPLLECRAIARCAWLDECGNIPNETTDHVQAFWGTETSPRQQQLYDHRAKCMANADEWRKWGGLIK